MTPETIDRVVKKFGETQDEAGRALGVHQSTIAYWKSRKRIPVDQIENMLAKAKELGIQLTPADFFEAETAV